jgi:hypothetical protein
MATQWNCTMGGYSGLNYPALEVLMRLYSVDCPKALFESIQVLELEALLLLNEQSANG